MERPSSAPYRYSNPPIASYSPSSPRPSSSGSGSNVPRLNLSRTSSSSSPSMSPRTVSPSPTERKSTSPASVLVSPRLVSRPVTSSEEKVKRCSKAISQSGDSGTQSLPSSPRYEVAQVYSSTGGRTYSPRSVEPQSPRTISMVARLTFACNLCLQERDLEEKFQLTSCAHRFDQQCLQKWLITLIDHGRSTDINCPYKDCPHLVQPIDVQKCLSEDHFQRYNYLAEKAPCFSVTDGSLVT